MYLFAEIVVCKFLCDFAVVSRGGNLFIWCIVCSYTIFAPFCRAQRALDPAMNHAPKNAHDHIYRERDRERDRNREKDRNRNRETDTHRERRRKLF